MIRSRQISLCKAADFIDRRVKSLNARSHQYITEQWKKAFPGRSAHISAGFMLGCHTLQWQPEIGIYGVDKLCLSLPVVEGRPDTGYWYDPSNANKQVVKTMPTPREIDKFCERMSMDIGVRVFFYRHNPPPDLLARIKQENKA